MKDNARENSRENYLTSEDIGENFRIIENSVEGERHGEYAELEITDFTQGSIFTPEDAINLIGVGMFQVKLIILSGFVWMTRGFEFTILIFVSFHLTCSWQLEEWEGAVINTTSLLSTALGCLLLGVWSDKYGRRMALSSSLIFLFVFRAISSGLRGYKWFVVFQTVASFAVGGFPQSLVLCCEYMPGRQRGRAIYILSCFWALGVAIMTYALFVTKDGESGWNIFIAIGSLPAFLALVMSKFFPESFRFLMVRNQQESANNIVTEIAVMNKKIIKLQLAPFEKQRRRNLILDFLHVPFRMPSSLFWTIGLMTSIVFYGLMFLTQNAILLKTHEIVPFNIKTMTFLGNPNDTIPCISGMSIRSFTFHVWTTSLDFLGFVIYMSLVDFIDRKMLLCASYLVSSLFIFLLYIDSLSYIIHVVVAFIPRILLMGQFDLLLLMIAETFPTSHRGTAVGLGASSFYLGHFLSAYIAQSLYNENILYSIVLYGVLTFLCALLACFNQETRGKPLMDIIPE